MVALPNTEHLTRIVGQKQATSIMVPLNQFTIALDAKGNTLYQRPISWRKVYEICGRKRGPDGKTWVYGHNWNPISAGTVIANMRTNGMIVLLDGQHRREAAALSGEMEISTSLYADLTVEQEAQVFVDCNTVRAQPSAIDLMRAKLVQHDVDALAIQDIVASCGLRIADRMVHGDGAKVKAVSALWHVYERGYLHDTLAFIVAAWPGQERAIEGDFMIGVSIFLVSYEAELKDAVVIRDAAEKLALSTANALTAEGVGRAATNRTSRSVGIAQAILSAYNNGKRGRRLPDNRIGSHTFSSRTFKG